jgi:hypothetical protein
MEWADVLLAIAEVSIAFAGFASIVAILGGREGGGWRTEDVDRFWVMIEYSFAALLFALVPFAFFHLGVGEPALWRVGSALMSTFLLGYAVMVARRLIRHRHRLAGGIRGHWRTLGALYGICGGLIGLEALNALSGLFDEPFGIYLVGILWLLSGAGFMFIRLLSVVRPEPRLAGGEGELQAGVAHRSRAVRLSEVRVHD